MLTILCWPPPHAWHILWCLRSQFISASRDPKNIWSDPKNSTALFNRVNSTVFSKSLNSQDHHFQLSVIYPLNSLQRPSSPIPCLGITLIIYIIKVICYKTKPIHQKQDVIQEQFLNGMRLALTPRFYLVSKA